MKKCFDNIKYMEISKMRDKFDATHMYSSDGEKVEFRVPVHLDGAVEVWTRTHMYNYLATTLGVLIFQVWMCDVEDCMRLSLKELLRECRVDLRKHLAKRGKWIRVWPGQVTTSCHFCTQTCLWLSVCTGSDCSQPDPVDC